MHPKLVPLYCATNIDSPAYHLRYAWTGWPSADPFPTEPPGTFFLALDEAWESDGIRRLEMNWDRDKIQLTCSVKPSVNPVFFVSRVKGRLQHALRVTGTRVEFSRKVCFRSIGENRREQVEQYILNQVTKERFVDNRFAEFMKQFTASDESVRLQEPTETRSGRYWYNLHVVLVTEARMRFTDQQSLERLAITCDKISLKNSYKVSRRSIMNDHIHLALRGDVEHSPEKIALSYMNNIAFAFGQKAIFRPSYYVGTFGEYDMGAVRQGDV